ncbi:hypothetical protein ACFQFH_02160 [Halobaculum halobium]|uniref:hypothetical protein n=1 Tax=Halobaculum halobium TaxID=3032281 RepID=UPI00362320BA
MTDHRHGTGPSFGFQLYSVREVDDFLATVVERVGAAGIDGVEFAGVTAGASTATTLPTSGRRWRRRAWRRRAPTSICRRSSPTRRASPQRVVPWAATASSFRGSIPTTSGRGGR